MSIQTAEEARAEWLVQEKRERRDCFDKMQSEAALRGFLGLLDEMGASRVMVTEDDMRMRNMADQILSRIANADPQTYVRLMLALKNI